MQDYAMWKYQKHFAHIAKSGERKNIQILQKNTLAVLPAKSDSDVMLCLQSYQGFIIERSLVY